MMELENDKTKVIHTQNVANGSMVVISDVPAHVWIEEGIEETVYDMDVALHIDDFISKYFRDNPPPNRVFTFSYKEIGADISTDLEMKILGEHISLHTTDSKVWKETTEKIHSSYNYIRRAFQDYFKVKEVGFPIINPVLGSLIFELRSNKQEQASIFTDEWEEVLNPEVRIMQLLIDGYAYAMGEEVDNALIQAHPQIAFAVVRAIEKLSPSGPSQIEAIEIRPASKAIQREKTITLTRDTQYRAKQKRLRLKTPEDQLVREVEIVGKVSLLETSGTFTIRAIEYNYPDGAKHPTKAIFHEKIRHQLADFWKHETRVLFKGVEYKVHGGDWSNIPVIKSAQEAPSLD